MKFRPFDIGAILGGGFRFDVAGQSLLLSGQYEHGFKSVREFVGKSLSYFSTHADLVQRQKAAKAAKAVGSGRDAETWNGS